jgi:hypothetical protein
VRQRCRGTDHDRINPDGSLRGPPPLDRTPVAATSPVSSSRSALTSSSARRAVDRGAPPLRRRAVPWPVERWHRHEFSSHRSTKWRKSSAASARPPARSAFKRILPRPAGSRGRRGPEDRVRHDRQRIDPDAGGVVDRVDDGRDRRVGGHLTDAVDPARAVDDGISITTDSIRAVPDERRTAMCGTGQLRARPDGLAPVGTHRGRWWSSKPPQGPMARPQRP